MFPFGYLFDENMDPSLSEALRRRHPDLPVWHVGDQLAPPRGTLDTEILKWCDEHGCVLVTNNRKSMPGHRRDHVESGAHMLGIFVLASGLPTPAAAALLWDLATLSLPREFEDQIRYFSRLDASQP